MTPRLKLRPWRRGSRALRRAQRRSRGPFESLALPEVLAFTAPANARSRAVMHRLAMTHDVGGDFDHPRLEPGHPLRRHVLYRLTRAAWQLSARGGAQRA
jgi:RimJ/RimL family protein N-acetyltransferase